MCIKGKMILYMFLIDVVKMFLIVSFFLIIITLYRYHCCIKLR